MMMGTRKYRNKTTSSESRLKPQSFSTPSSGKRPSEDRDTPESDRAFKRPKNTKDLAHSAEKEVQHLPKISFSYIASGITVKRTLGSGYFSVVKLVQDKTSGMLMALKCINGKRANKELIEQEVSVNRIVGTGESPLFLAFYGRCTIESTCETETYLFLEFFNGKDLGELLNEYKFTRPAKEIIMKQYCQALQFLSEKGIMHRDLKPGNTMVNENTGEIRVIDFGLAKIGNHSRVRAGTPNFMAPEILRFFGNRDAPSYGPEVDVFSAGVIMYTMIYGENPLAYAMRYHQLQEKEAIEHFLNVGVEYPKGATLESDEYSLLEKLLQMNPSDRPDPLSIQSHPYFRAETFERMTDGKFKDYLRKNYYLRRNR